MRARVSGHAWPPLRWRAMSQTNRPSQPSRDAHASGHAAQGLPIGSTQLNPAEPLHASPHTEPPHAEPKPMSDAATQAETRVMPERPLIDVMHGASRIEKKVLDHGFIALVDTMPRLVPEGQTADQAIVQANLRNAGVCHTVTMSG